jgi:hypothetical protein
MDWLTWSSGGTSTLEGITAGAVLVALVAPRLARRLRARAARRGRTARDRRTGPPR